MARVALVPTEIVLGGTKITGTVGTNDDMECPNNGNLILVVVNAAGLARDISFMTANLTDRGAPYEDKTISLDASSTYVFGGIERAPWNTSAKLIEIDLDAGNESDLTVQAFTFTRVT